MPVGGTSNVAPQQQYATVPPSSDLRASQGPPAWNDEWMARFSAAGADSQTLQTLMVTGGDGQDEAGLQQLLQQVQQRHAQLMSQLQAKFPGELATLQKSKLTSTQIADLAQQVVDGKLDKRAFMAKVDDAYAASGSGQIRSIAFDMAPYSIIPGWGAISTGLGLANGAVHGDLATSRNPLSRRQLFGTTMDQVQTPLMALGGAFTLYNLARENKDIRLGRAAARVPGSIEARIAHLNGVDPAASKGIAAINPFSRDNRILAMLSRYQDVKSGVEHMEAVAHARAALGHAPADIGAEHVLARDVLTRWENGTTPVMSDSVMSYSKMGIWPKVRGVFMNRNAPMVKVKSVNGIPSFVVSSRLRGGIAAAHMASADTQAASGKVLDAVRALHGNQTEAAARELMLAKGTQDVMTPVGTRDALVHARTGLQNLADIVRPGGVKDGLQAIDHLKAGTIGMPHGFAGLPTVGKVGIVAAGIAAVVGGALLIKQKMAGGGGEQPAADGASEQQQPASAATTAPAKRA